jgi:hypothetical protein
MKPCATPLCDGEAKRAAMCRRCRDRAREQTPERKAWATKYRKTKRYRELHRRASQDYRDAGKVQRGECVDCGGATNDTRALRCLACYRARVLPVASRRGLMAIHGRPV